MQSNLIGQYYHSSGIINADFPAFSGLFFVLENVEELITEKQKEFVGRQQEGL